MLLGPLGPLGLLVLLPQPLLALSPQLPCKGAWDLGSLEPFPLIPSLCRGMESAFFSVATPPPRGCAAMLAVESAQWRFTKSCFVLCCWLG